MVDPRANEMVRLDDSTAPYCRGSPSRSDIIFTMKYSPLIGLVALCLLGGHIARGDENTNQSDSDWISLFDGKTLKGWHIVCLPKEKEKAKSYWSVDEGAILCDTGNDPNHGYVWLISDAEYDDFELKLKCQAYRDVKGNSGVQVRSRYDASPNAPQGGWLDGPQVDIHPPAPWRTGLIYDETRTERRWICPSRKSWKIDKQPTPDGWTFRYADDPKPWNELHITCRGTRIVTKLNGVLIVDYDGEGVLNNAGHRKYKVGTTGHIALQLHSRDLLKIRFKDIAIKPLSK